MSGPACVAPLLSLLALVVDDLPKNDRGKVDRRALPPIERDTLRAAGEVLELRPSKAGDRGIVRLRYSTHNQKGETVFTVIGNQIVRRRPADTN